MKKTLRIMMPLLWMGLIFFFSSQPQVESAQTSNAAAELIFELLSLIFKDIDRQAFIAISAGPLRKIAHFSEFAILAILFCFAFDIEDETKNALICFSCTAAYAVSDEIHQLFVAGRYCSLADMGIDILGGMAGIAIYHLIYRRWKKVSG